jgi:hypothetical protein
MSWRCHIREEDQDDLETKALAHLIPLVRVGFFSGLLHAGNQARVAQGLEPIRQTPAMKHTLEKHINRHVEAVISHLYQRAGRPGVSHLAWLELQFENLKDSVADSFRNHS